MKNEMLALILAVGKELALENSLKALPNLQCNLGDVIVLLTLPYPTVPTQVSTMLA